MDTLRFFEGSTEGEIKLEGLFLRFDFKEFLLVELPARSCFSIEDSLEGKLKRVGPIPWKVDMALRLVAEVGIFFISSLKIGATCLTGLPEFSDLPLYNTSNSFFGSFSIFFSSYAYKLSSCAYSFLFNSYIGILGIKIFALEAIRFLDLGASWFILNTLIIQLLDSGLTKTLFSFASLFSSESSADSSTMVWSTSNSRFLDDGEAMSNDYCFSFFSSADSCCF